MLTPDQLDAIRSRLNAATPGPWIAEYSSEQGNCVIPHDALSTREAVCVTRLYHAAADAELIAHAPTDLADLLTEVDRLTADLAAAAAKLATISDMCQPKTLKAGPWPSIWGRDLLRIIHPPRPAPAREPKPLDTGDWTPDRIWTEETQ